MEIKTKLPYMCDKCHKPLQKDHWKITEKYGGYGASTTKKWDLCDTCYKMLCDFVDDKRQLTQQEMLNLFPIFERSEKVNERRNRNKYIRANERYKRTNMEI